MTRRPAYARQLAATIAAGYEPLHGIAVWLDRRPPDGGIFAHLACFSDTDPAALDWGLCYRRDVIVPCADQCNQARLDRLLAALAAADPRRLQTWSANGDNVRFLIVGRVAA
ncbi:hypothetical protein [Pseudazoarcus pumilus]|uniref:hypothetical protein n=1 Tax=Pseudazoarcus pumilus TaxID=2067960 RepID=UPI000F4D8201|nr:hypothetical protein [Pseudazoarcus pumilus]